MQKQKYAFRPDYAIPPGWILEEELEVRGISPDEFAKQCGCAPELIRGIITGGSVLEHDMAVKFEQLLGTMASIWVGIESKYQAHRAQKSEGADAPSEAA